MTIIGISSIIQSKVRNPRTPTVMYIGVLPTSPYVVVLLSALVVVGELETDIIDATIISPAQDPE